MRALLLLVPLLLLAALTPTATALTVVCSTDPGPAPDGIVPLATWAVELADNRACTTAEATCRFAWDQVFGYPGCYVGWQYRDNDG